jgi:N-acetylneuraminic acid mutarotase
MKPRFFLFLLLLISLAANAQGPWTQKASFAGFARHRPFTFSIGSRGYVGCGWNGTTMYQDFWEYDPGTNSWTQKTDYPAGPRLSAFGFSIGNKGYAGCGLDQFLYAQPDFYEYNPATNAWTAKANFTGTPIFGASSAVANNKAYIICGDDWDPAYWRHNEVYVYDPSTNSWNFSTYFPSDGRRDPLAASVANKIYTGTGNDNSYNENGDWWKFDPSMGTWTQLVNFGGSARSQAVAFAVNGKIYAGTGGVADEVDFWEFDPALNAWSRIDDFPGQGRENAASFVIGNKAYLVCGTSGTNYNDLWEFDSGNIGVATGEINPGEIMCGIFPNPVVSASELVLQGMEPQTEKELSVFAADGKLLWTEKFTGNKTAISAFKFSPGNYPYAVRCEGKIIARGTIIRGSN